MHLSSTELAELKNILMPFLKTAKGIPNNWPKQCSLFYDTRINHKNEEYAYINYHKAGIDAGPTIGDYHKLEEWCKEYKVEDWGDV